MNGVGFTLSAVGNHEFDTGPEGFGSLQAGQTSASSVPTWISGADPVSNQPYKILTLPNGLRLLFWDSFQVSQNGIPDTHPDIAGGFTFLPPFETARKYMWLKDVSDHFHKPFHLGFEEDVRLAETMARRYDLIIGGHSHTRVGKEQIHNGIMITQLKTS